MLFIGINLSHLYEHRAIALMANAITQIVFVVSTQTHLSSPLPTWFRNPFD